MQDQNIKAMLKIPVRNHFGLVPGVEKTMVFQIRNLIFLCGFYGFLVFRFKSRKPKIV